MWVRDPWLRLYYETEEERYMLRTTVIDYRDRSIAAAAPVTDTLGTLTVDGPLSPDAWRDSMREEIKREYIREYLLGIGGLEQMTQEDWGRIGGMLTEQYRHLEKFYDEIVAGKLSPAQIMARSQMYSQSAREAFERANAQAWGGPPLDTYPGDGKVCAGLTNCNCNWEIASMEVSESMIRWKCYWRLGAVKTQHCDRCVNASIEWAPLIVSREVGSA